MCHPQIWRHQGLIKMVVLFKHHSEGFSKAKLRRESSSNVLLAVMHCLPGLQWGFNVGIFSPICLLSV